tara:strand:+ start:6591 stop:7172 length:582 start_codon:yes stop_codon:yes gene_type:complete
MSQLKLTADGGGGTVAIKAPASTTGNAAIELTVPGTGNATLLTSATSTGKILQVVSANKTTVQSTSSTSYVDVTDMTASITPSSSSSKVLVMMTLTIQKSDYTFFARLLRNSTEIGTPSGNNSGISVYNSNDQNQNEGRAVIFLDSPNTTNATTYKLQMRSDGSSTIYFNAHSSGTTNDYITPSSITLMEVGT